MPKKRHNANFGKPFSASSASSNSARLSSERQPRSVNDILSDLRRSSLGPSSQSSSPSVTSPSVPPLIRQILQIPESPAPRPRRPVRQRYDGQGRRLPAGPPPPRSWLSRGRQDSACDDALATLSKMSRLDSTQTLFGSELPDAHLPQAGSLVGMVLQRLAFNWDFHKVYDYYHLYYLPSHLKPALIRWIGILSDEGVALADLKLLLAPPSDLPEGEEADVDFAANAAFSYLDLSGSVGRSIKLKELSEFLFPCSQAPVPDELQDTWDAAAPPPSPPRILLPNLTHLSLAMDPRRDMAASWKQLLTLSAKLSTITHLSLAYWPEPCLTPRAKTSSVVSPQGQTVAYGGTSYYSHSIDQDWSEALLVLRMLSSRMYALECLDLTGCAPWFKALMARSEHDFVDWAGSWGKITLLRLRVGWGMSDDAKPSEQVAYREGVRIAVSVERHIRAMRAGKGRIITVERDEVFDQS